MTTTLYPAWKEAAKVIGNEDKIFYANWELEKLLREKQGSQKYNLARMMLKSKLLNEFGIDFIPVKEKDTNKSIGYKKATAEESVKITTARLQRRHKRTNRIQRKIIDTIDRNELSIAAKTVYDARIVQSGLMRAFLKKSNLKKCLPGSTVKIDHPKIVQTKSDILFRKF